MLINVYLCLFMFNILFKLITLSPLMPYFISENEIMSNLFSLIDLIKIA